MFDDLRPHLIELRKRLAYSVAAIFVMFIVIFVVHEPVLQWITQPLYDALAVVGEQSKVAAEGMVTTNQVGGVMFVTLKVAFFGGLLASIPVILAQIWLFIAPGLYDNEKKMLIPFVVGGSTMFFIGAAFSYYVVIPFGFDFLIAFGAFQYVPLINIEDYVGFFSKIMFGFGIAFELPVFAYFLALLGLVDDRQMASFFKYAIVLIFGLAALLTPPDIVTQLLMAIPLILLYGASILIVKAVNPAEKDDDDDTEESSYVETHEGAVERTTDP